MSSGSVQIAHSTSVSQQSNHHMSTRLLISDALPQRVVLLTHNKAADTISLRHYCISVARSGLTKGVKALVGGRDVPDLSRFNDVADYIEKAGFASESEGEDAAASRVETGVAKGGAKTWRVRLHEARCRLYPGTWSSSGCAARQYIHNALPCMSCLRLLFCA